METAAAYNERALLLEVAEGSEAAFTQLFRQWQPFLAAHIFRITESKTVTEEIVQDVFLKVWQTRETLAAIHNFKGYLIVVSKNMAINALQKMAREFQQLSTYTKEHPATDDTDPEAEQYSLIDEAIDQLSSRQKEVYLLHRHQRMTYQQIADHLGIGKESVKTHIELAVKNISGYVKDKMGLLLLLILWQG